MFAGSPITIIISSSSFRGTIMARVNVFGVNSIGVTTARMMGMIACMGSAMIARMRDAGHVAFASQTRCHWMGTRNRKRDCRRQHAQQIDKRGTPARLQSLHSGQTNQHPDALSLSQIVNPHRIMGNPMPANAEYPLTSQM